MLQGILTNILSSLDRNAAWLDLETCFCNGVCRLIQEARSIVDQNIYALALLFNGLNERLYVLFAAYISLHKCENASNQQIVGEAGSDYSAKNKTTPVGSDSSL